MQTNEEESDATYIKLGRPILYTAFGLESVWYDMI